MSAHLTLVTPEQRADERSGFRSEDQHGIACRRAGHIDGCAGSSGGEHELLPGWISTEIDGVTVEVEVTGA